MTARQKRRLVQRTVIADISNGDRRACKGHQRRRTTCSGDFYL